MIVLMRLKVLIVLMCAVMEGVTRYKGNSVLRVDLVVMMEASVCMILHRKGSSFGK